MGEYDKCISSTSEWKFEETLFDFIVFLCILKIEWTFQMGIGARGQRKQKY